MIDATLTPLFERPLSEEARGFLRKVKRHNGRLALTVTEPSRLADECRRVCYLHITEDYGMALLTGLGQAYLDRQMRAN